jgi:hypothetical protein
MSPAEQEKLFAVLKAAHPDFPDRFISGYVHGAADEAERKHPKGEFKSSAKVLDLYAVGYLTGFAVHRGPDAQLEPWFSLTWKIE